MSDDNWYVIPNADILAENRRLWDHWDKSIRKRIHRRDLPDLPLINDNGKEVRIYDDNGDRIARRAARLYPDQKPCGVLVNFDHVNKLFSKVYHHRRGSSSTSNDSNDDDNYNDDDDVTPYPAAISRFPQAFLKTCGHIQCPSGLVSVEKILKEMNGLLQTRIRDADRADHRQWANNVGTGSPLTASKTQFYNEVQHAGTHQHGGLVTQHGTTTKYMAGTYIFSDNKDRKKFDRIKDSITTETPWAQMERVLGRNGTGVGIRGESIYCIDMDLVCPSRRIGSSVYFAIFKTVCIYLIDHQVAIQ